MTRPEPYTSVWLLSDVGRPRATSVAVSSGNGGVLAADEGAPGLPDTDASAEALAFTDADTLAFGEALPLAADADGAGLPAATPAPGTAAVCGSVPPARPAPSPPRGQNRTAPATATSRTTTAAASSVSPLRARRTALGGSGASGSSGMGSSSQRWNSRACPLTTPAPGCRSASSRSAAPPHADDLPSTTRSTAAGMSVNNAVNIADSGGHTRSSMTSPALPTTTR